MGDDVKWMKLALEEAAKAEQLGEVPIGAVIVKNNELISTGYNRREVDAQATAHAELIAIEEACKQLSAWRLTGCTLYVTLEPCPMCAGAIIQARLDKVVYGAADQKAGCAGSLMNLLQDQRFNHQTDVVAGCLQEECGSRLSHFFQELRKKKKALKGLSKNE
ncbi:adenosine deaminase [Alkalihalobacillus pseudalcaliphilus]|nr:adenosine deaminase [Alkalihalobacillus pseudalcaliphilus]